MTETKSVKTLKKQLGAAIAIVCVAAVALGSSTYAWFVTNNNVKADNMTVMANSDVEFLEIANVGTNFDGKTIAVNADNSGANLKLNPVTPLKVTAMTKDGTEGTDLDFKTSGTLGTEGYAEGLSWKWTTAQVGTASAKGNEAAWQYAKTAADAEEKYFLLNNFKFRTTVSGVETDKLYASTVDLTNNVTKNAMDEAVRVLIIGANGSQIYNVGTQQWSYFDKDGKSVAKDNFEGLITKVVYGADNSENQSVKVFLYYEGADAALYTTNLNTMQGVTANITFSVDPTAFGA